jgi:hypothetical protein
VVISISLFYRKNGLFYEIFMGVFPSCSSCCSDPKTELELRSSMPCSPGSLPIIDVQTNHSTDGPNTSDADAKQAAAMTILTYWRGYSSKKQISAIINLHRSKYFPRADVLETLSNTALPQHREDEEPRTYSSGAVYQGQWLGGFRDGLGCMQWPDGSEYIGNWQFGYPCGKGRFTTPDGDSYKGRWSSSPFQAGQNCIGRVGEGNRESLKDGFDWLWCKENVIETSPFSAEKSKVQKALSSVAKRIAKIREELEAQSEISDEKEVRDEDWIYKGQVHNHRKHGYGRLVYDNGDTFFGQWHADKQYGLGCNTWVDGSHFIGVYAADSKQGAGEYTWEDGIKYTGEWAADQRHGYGSYSWPDGRRYEGEWSKGSMQGFGVYSFSDGKRYEGSWLKGKKHGLGILYMPNGASKEEVWDLGKLTRA